MATPFDPLPSLRRSHQSVERAWTAFPARGRHCIPDLLLLGLTLDTRENAAVVLKLAEGNHLGHRSWPSARAAFEASQIALLLATAEDYDWEGALGWVYYLLRDDRLILQASSAVDSDDTSYDGLAARVEYWAEQWEDLADGRGELIRRAGAHLSENPPSRNNYLGVNVAAELERRFMRLRSPANSAAGNGMAHTFRVAFGLLSREAHPYARFQPDRLKLDVPSDRLVFEVDDDYREERTHDAVLVTAASCELGAVALAKRTAAVLTAENSTDE